MSPTRYIAIAAKAEGNSGPTAITFAMTLSGDSSVAHVAVEPRS